MSTTSTVTQSSRDCNPLSTLVIATDSEWHSLDNTWLATSFTVREGVNKLGAYLFITNNIPVGVKQTLIEWGNTNLVTVQFVDRNDDNNLLDIVVGNIDPLGQYKSIRLLMYYSPKDIEYTFGWSNVKPLILGEVIQQKRGISTPKPFKTRNSFNQTEYYVSIKDLRGWSTGSLKSLAGTVGLTMVSKADMDEYKIRMRDGLEALPTVFASYAMGDTSILHDIYDAYVEMVRWVQRDIIGIADDDCFTANDIPMTVGSLVAATLDKWIYTQYPNKQVLKYAMNKLGILDVNASDHRYNLAAFINTTKKYSHKKTGGIINLANDLDRWVVNQKVDEFKQLNQFMKGGAYQHLAHSQAGVKYFSKVTSDSATFNAIVQGGRCNNERPSEYSINTVGADIDLASCYGSALRQFIYPVGLPTVWGYTPNQQRPTLRQWLKRNGSKLVDNLWTLTVEGDISFRQDLIYSKLVTQHQINRAAFGDDSKETNDDKRDDNISHIPGEFALIRKQIRNGIITSEILTTLKAVATNQELSELYDNLTVVSGVAYLSSNRVNNVDEWVNTVIKDTGVYINRGGVHSNTTDTRTRAWVVLPMEEFIGKLVNERSRLKAAGKAGDDNAAARQNVLKLFVNTSYGVIASPFFSVGNTVVANNITARARVGAWMLNKALHTRQSITDGGMYSLTTVPFINANDRKPGLDILSDNTRWFDLAHAERRTIAPLGNDIDWTAAVTSNDTEVLTQLDAIAGEHIAAFWGRYGLTLPFDIEHKMDNCFTTAAYFSKAHYLLTTTGKGGDVYKIRGAREYTSDSGLRQHPTFELLKAMATGDDVFPSELEYDHKSLMKIGKWLEIQQSNGYAALKECRPGDEVIEERTARYNNTHTFCDTVNQFKNRVGRKTFEGGQPVELFERYRQGGISKVHYAMMMDNLAAYSNYNK